MSESVQKIVILALGLLGLVVVNGFNLSPQPNFKLQEPVDQKFFIEKVRSSYFGYSVNLRTDSVMVGAPQAQSTVEMQRKINETGAIYKCSLSDSSCSPFVFDELGDVSQQSINGYYQSLKKEGQWLGMAMDGKGSSSDKLVVCAPKMITPQQDHYLLHGICYVTSNTSGTKPLERPTRIIPFQKIVIQTINDGTGNIYYYMFGELGISVHVSENSEEILIGAPGVYNWKGTIVRYRPIYDTDQGGLSKRDNYKKRSPERSVVLEYETNVPNPDNWNQTQDSYFGFAVTSAYFEGPESIKLLYAASAPQDKPTGKVRVFDIVDYGNQPEAKTLKIYFEANGDQLGEYFGYSLLAEDFNGDGLPDLLVGAPMNSDDHITDNGAVYYYQNLGQVDFEMKALLRSGSTKAGRFGMALGRIGDIDLDGYNDVAIGSPFEDNGAVYIFLGGPEGPKTKPSQRIASPEVNELLSPGMFGMSISRGVDVDANGYNDIAVGAPNAESVFVYRSYPVMKIVAVIESDKRELSQHETELLVKVCVNLQTNFGHAASAKLRLSFKLDTQFGRAFFFDDKTNVKEFDFDATHVKSCMNFDVTLTFKLNDIFKPLDLQLHYTNLNAPTDSEVFCDNCYALNPNDPSFVSTKLIYRTGCSSDRCLADLKLTAEVIGAASDPYILGSTKTISIQYTVENWGEQAYLPQIRIIKSAQISFTRIPPRCRIDEVTLLCDVAKISMGPGESEGLLITLDSSNLEGEALTITAEAFSTGDEKTVDDNRVTVSIRLAEFSEIETTGSAQPNEISTVESGDKINITHRFEIRNDGPSLIKQAEVYIDIPLKYSEERLKSLIDFHSIIVKAKYNDRRLPVSWSQNNVILIQNPTESTLPIIADDQHALQYDNLKMGLDFEMPPDQNTLEQIQNDQVYRRKKRDVEEGVRTYNAYTQRVMVDQEVSRRNLRSSYDDIISNRTLTFDGNDCETHTCVRMTTVINNFRPSRSAELFIDVTVEMDLVEVVKLFTENKDIFLFRMGVDFAKQSDLSRETISHQILLPYTVIQTKIDHSTPIWVWIVSSICGVLVLVLLTYGLYKAGFFKRAQREEMARLTRESKQIDDETDDE